MSCLTIEGTSVPTNSKTISECARTRKLLIEANALEIPVCDKMGNYPPATCRRGRCFCLDGEDQDGLQTSNEVDVNDICNLSCCQNGNCGCSNH